MKRIIRLTESDLTRIVKRVLQESPIDGVVKVKVFGGSDDQKKNMTRSCNIEAKNLKVVGEKIKFDYTIPGGAKCMLYSLGSPNTSGLINANGQAQIFCGDNDYVINFINSSDDNKLILGFLTKEGYDKLSYMCDEYASAEDDDNMDSDFA